MTSRVVIKIIFIVVLFIIFLKMSLNRLAIVGAIGTHNTMKNRTDDIRLNKNPSIEQRERPNATTFNGDVNVLLGGAMFSVVISIVCFVCYCCHRSHKQRDVVYRERWLQVDPNMDIYSVEQYYDISTNNLGDDDEYTRIIRNQGPPPAYEIAVTMKNPISLAKCHLCQNRIRFTCSCDPSTTKAGEEVIDKTTNLRIQTSDQLLNVKNISQQESPCCCTSKSVCTNQNKYLIPKRCQTCDEEIPCKNTDEDVQNGNSQERYCQCSSYDLSKPQSISGLGGREKNGHDINDNLPSTSGDVNYSQNCDLDSNDEESDDEIEDVAEQFDSLNENGLIRVDMRKIIDQTGLPSYEAALKLESSGYV